jgi:hypothetical protein
MRPTVPLRDERRRTGVAGRCLDWGLPSQHAECSSALRNRMTKYCYLAERVADLPVLVVCLMGVIICGLIVGEFVRGVLVCRIRVAAQAWH